MSNTTEKKKKKKKPRKIFVSNSWHNFDPQKKKKTIFEPWITILSWTQEPKPTLQPLQKSFMINQNCYMNYVRLYPFWGT